MKLSRRDFLRTSGVTLVGACVCGTCFNSCSTISGVSNTPTALSGSFSYEENNLVVSLSQNSQLSKIGGSIKLDAKKPNGTTAKVIIVRSDSEVFITFSDSCTHRGKELEYRHNEKRLRCASFGHSEFDLEGKVLKGPAKEPIIVYPTKIEGDEIIVSFE